MDWKEKYEPDKPSPSPSGFGRSVDSQRAESKLGDLGYAHSGSEVWMPCSILQAACRFVCGLVAPLSPVLTQEVRVTCAYCFLSMLNKYASSRCCSADP